MSESVEIWSEYGKALSCFERALFFVDEAPGYLVDPEGGHFPYEAEISIEVNQGDSTGGADHFEVFAYITKVYVVAGDLLFTRLSKVSDEYQQLRAEVMEGGVRLADRDPAFGERSSISVSKKLHQIAKRSTMRAEAGSPVALQDRFALQKEDWKGLGNICGLFMEEIRFLAGRIDDLYSYLNSAKSLGQAQEALIKTDASLQGANRSLRIAVWGFGLGLIAFVVGTVFSIVGLLRDGDEKPPILDTEEIQEVIREQTGRVIEQLEAPRSADGLEGPKTDDSGE